MPMQSQKQRAYLWSQHPDIARIFEDHTPKGTKLPVRVAPKKESPVKPTKEAFVQAVMEKAAASGVNTPRELLTFVEKIGDIDQRYEGPSIDAVMELYRAVRAEQKKEMDSR